MNLLMLLITLSLPLLYAQNLNLKAKSPNKAARFYKPVETPDKSFLKALVVFVEFEGDKSEYPDWNYGKLPAYAGSLFDSQVSDKYRSMTITDYWKVMSFAKFNFIGDIYPKVVRIKPESHYSSGNKNFQDCNRDALEIIDPHINYDEYDNWSPNPDGSLSFRKDGIVDMIYIIYRNPQGAWFHKPYENFTGIAMLGNKMQYQSDENVTINGSFLSANASGITMRIGAGVYYPNLLRNMLHEYGHYLFGTGHSEMAGIMGATESSGFALSGWERMKLGYINPVIAEDNKLIELNDYVTTGDMLLIPFPKNAGQYYLVENHQRLSEYDQIMRGGELEGVFTPDSKLGSGIYVWYISRGNSFPPIIDVKTANGTWDWQLVDSIKMGPGWPAVMPIIGRTAINRIDGKSDKHPRVVQFKGHWWPVWHDTIGLEGQISLTRSIMGLPEHAFNKGYSEVFTPWSNPSSNYKKIVSNTGFEIVSQNGYKITLKTVLTEQSALSLSPSKPQWLRIKNNSLIFWEPNIEPDLIEYRIYHSKNNSDWNRSAVINKGGNQFSIKEAGYYRITAVDQQGKESAPSDPVLVNR